MKPLAILVDSFADEGLTNAQMINAREIVSRLDPDRFSVTMFMVESPDLQLTKRPNTRLIQLPRRLQTIPLLSQFVFGRHEILFYLKASPASWWYMKLRRLGQKRCVTVGTVESQTDWRDETITAPTIRLLEDTVLRCDYLFSNSELVKRSLAANYARESEVVATGVDTDFFTPDEDGPANRRPRILFVGALRRFKAPHAILDAAQRFPDADFVMVGDGPMAQELHTRANGLPNVIMRGTLGRAEIRQEYRSADIFLFLSRWEGSPRVLMEAAASGLPVIARKDYEPESVIDGKTGFLVADDEEANDRLARLTASADLRRAFGQSARLHMNRFSWDVVTRQWEAIFCNLASESRRKKARS
jgi:glycosyltransferase involved in cell wall biosynthesis